MLINLLSDQEIFISELPEKMQLLCPHTKCSCLEGKWNLFELKLLVELLFNGSPLFWFIKFNYSKAGLRTERRSLNTLTRTFNSWYEAKKRKIKKQARKKRIYKFSLASGRYVECYETNMGYFKNFKLKADEKEECGCVRPSERRIYFVWLGKSIGRIALRIVGRNK